MYWCNIPSIELFSSGGFDIPHSHPLYLRILPHSADQKHNMTNKKIVTIVEKQLCFKFKAIGQSTRRSIKQNVFSFRLILLSNLSYWSVSHVNTKHWICPNNTTLSHWNTCLFNNAPDMYIIYIRQYKIPKQLPITLVSKYYISMYLSYLPPWVKGSII